MVKIRLPLLSGEAWGTFGKMLTFAKKRTVQYVKKYQRYTYTRSEKQDLMRKRFDICQMVWKDLTDLGRKQWSKFAMPNPWCKTNPFLKTNLNTGWPCREVPELPGVQYNRKSEWIVGLAKIGITPMGVKTLYKYRWQ